MVGLDYYDPLYRTLPYWHKSVGLLAAFVLIARILWINTHSKPLPATTSAPGSIHTLARMGHFALYVLMIAMIISGYLISTAKGKGIDVMGWFEIPALLSEHAERGEWAGKVHKYAGLVFILLVGTHIAGALMHHFYWKDSTLKRMLPFGKH